MYDPKSEAREFVGADRAEAVAKASRYFELEEAELALGELDPGQVFGAGGRTVVVAVPRQARARVGHGREREGGDRGRDRDRDRGRGRDRGERGPRRREERGHDRGGRGGDGPRRDFRGEGSREARPRYERAEAGPRMEVEPLDEEPLAEAQPLEDVGPSTGTARSELTEIGSFVLGVIERMELGSFEISETEEDDLRVLQVRGPAGMRLTGGDGRSVDAIQLLANQAAMRLFEEPPRVVLEVEGDRERREAYLEDLAERAARRAISMGRAVALDPMSSKDRRVLHVALRGARDVATMSTGSGRYRQVVVVPRGAPEYEQAVRYAEEAANRGEG